MRESLLRQLQRERHPFKKQVKGRCGEKRTVDRDGKNKITEKPRNNDRGPRVGAHFPNAGTRRKKEAAR